MFVFDGVVKECISINSIMIFMNLKRAEEVYENLDVTSTITLITFVIFWGLLLICRQRNKNETYDKSFNTRSILYVIYETEKRSIYIFFAYFVIDIKDALS